MVDHNITVPAGHGYDLHLGIDALTLDAKNRVVDGAATTAEGGGGSDSSFIMKRVESTSDLMKALGVDVDASVGSVLFGASAKERFSYAQSQHVQSSSLFMTITASVELPDLSIDEPVLTSAAQADIGVAQTFHDRYGDCFVKTIVRGGLFVGVLKIDTSSSADADTISNQLSGTYGLVASADVGVKITSTANRFHSEVSVDLFSSGGPVFQKPADSDALLRCLNDFLDSLRTDPDHNAKIFQVVLAPVQDAEGPLPPNAVDIAHAQQVLTFCAKMQLSTLDNLNLVSDYIARPDRYDFPATFQPADARTLADSLQADLDLIAQCASAAMNNPLQAREPADFAQSIGTPFPQGLMPSQLPTLKPVVVAATLKIPSFFGCHIDDVEATQEFLVGASVDEVLSGFDTGDGHIWRTSLTRDQVVCLSYVQQTQQLAMQWNPPGISSQWISETTTFAVDSQSIPADTMVAPGSELDLNFVAVSQT
ncbi:MAG TPA: hypothetical protein VME67_15700 [Mycobacterium sp.]|nr:hypothetical protein [Mycobacterium sp.]HTX96170.1 hypothetical protein [Mycobacterium sp.]